VAQVEAQTLTEEQIKSILDLAAVLAPGLAEAIEDFDARRVLIEKLNVQAQLEVEDAKRFVRASAVFGRSKRLPIVADTIMIDSPPIPFQAQPALPGPAHP
jgi:hypothetical protein